MRKVQLFSPIIFLFFLVVVVFSSCAEKDKVIPKNRSVDEVINVKEIKYFDPVSGETYLINHNRRRLTFGEARSSSGRVNSPALINAPVSPIVSDWSGEVEIAIWESSSSAVPI